MYKVWITQKTKPCNSEEMPKSLHFESKSIYGTELNMDINNEGQHNPLYTSKLVIIVLNKNISFKEQISVLMNAEVLFDQSFYWQHLREYSSPHVMLHYPTMCMKSENLHNGCSKGLRQECVKQFLLHLCMLTKT